MREPQNEIAAIGAAATGRAEGSTAERGEELPATGYRHESDPLSVNVEGGTGRNCQL